MATIYGKIISVELETQIKYANKPGTYTGYRIVYNDDTGQVKTWEKSLQGLKFNPTFTDVLRSLVHGDDFTMNTEKKGQFLELTGLSKGHGSDASFSNAAQAATADAGKAAVSADVSRPYTPRTTGNTYETPEERKLKQRLIVRQAALNQALEFAKNSAEVDDYDTEYIRNLAETFEDWVYRGL